MTIREWFGDHIKLLAFVALAAVACLAMGVLMVVMVSGRAKNDKTLDEPAVVESEQIFKVVGQVLLDDKLVKMSPVGSGRVRLIPDEAKGNRLDETLSAKVGKNGYYQVNKARPGWYKVAVIAREPVDAKDPSRGDRSVIPERYGDEKTSGLAFEVGADAKKGAYNLNMTK